MRKDLLWDLGSALGWTLPGSRASSVHGILMDPISRGQHSPKLKL